MSSTSDVLGLDWGATLIKLAYRRDAVVTERFSREDAGAARARIEALGPRRIVATGGGAAELGGFVGGAAVEVLSEFEAWSIGASAIAAEEGKPLPSRHIVASVGTGTSVVVVMDSFAQRAGGTGLGGGTLLGLGRLLTGARSFAELSALAEKGARQSVDLLIGDIYREGSPLPVEWTAANFGKLASTEPADLAHALMGMVGENVAIVCAGVARIVGVSTVVLAGSTLEGNAALCRVLEGSLAAGGLEARFLERGAYAGAIGALVAGEREPG